MSNAEVSEAVDTLMTSFDSFRAEHTRRLDQLEARLNRPGLIGPNSTNGDLAAERKAIGMFCRTGSDIELKQVVGLSTDVDPAGGYVVLPQMSDRMTRRIYDQSPIHRLSRVQTMDTGDAWAEPLDLDESSASWVSEHQARPSLSAPQLGLLTVPLNELYSVQTVTQKLMDLSFVDIGAWVESKLADKFARTEALAYVSGNGVAQPLGFMSLAKSTAGDYTRASSTLQYVPSGDASTITADGLRDLYWTLRAPHRGNATWLMASATANTIDKLKASGTGEYLWRDSSTAGAPPTLLGRPVEFDENMPAVTGGNYAIAFGDFQAGYLIVDRQGMKWLRDPYSDKPNVLIYAYRRTGGGVALTDAIKLLKIGTS